MERKVKRRHLLQLGAAAAATVPAAAIWAEAAWSPTAPVRLTVPFTPGGPFDMYARAIADRLGPRLGQPVILDFKPGAGQAIGGDFVRRQLPDGLSLFIMSTSFLLNSVLTKPAYDAVEGFTPLVELGDGDFIIAVSTEKHRARTPQQFIEWAKEEKDRAFYGLPNRGGGGHLIGELINKRAGLTMQPVAYKGSAPMMTDLLGGQISLIIETMGTVKPFLDSGKVTVVANCSNRRSPLFTQVPTLSETVLPGFDLRAWYGMLLPPGTPAPIVERYNKEINGILKDPVLVDLFARNGIGATGGTADNFKRSMRSLHTLYTQIVKDANITV